MGCFALRVESAAQEVNELLALHKVHTGVREDVKQRLRRLIEDAYEEMEALQCGQEACSYQVCHAIVSDVVEQTLKVALPTADLVREQQRSAALQQEVMELKERLAAKTTQCGDMESVLHDLKRAHDYVLHSYFKEVRVLRFKLHDLRHRYQAQKEQQAAGHAPNSFRAASFRRVNGFGNTTQSFLLANNNNNNNNNSNSAAQARAAGVTTLSEFLASHEGNGIAGHTLSPTVEADLCVSFTTPSSTPLCNSSLPIAAHHGSLEPGAHDAPAARGERHTHEGEEEEEQKEKHDDDEEGKDNTGTTAAQHPTPSAEEDESHNNDNKSRSEEEEDESVVQSSSAHTNRSTPRVEGEDEEASEARLLAAFDSTQSPRIRVTPPIAEQNTTTNTQKKDDNEEGAGKARVSSALDKSSGSSAPSSLLSLVHGASSHAFCATTHTDARPSEGEEEGAETVKGEAVQAMAPSRAMTATQASASALGATSGAAVGGGGGGAVKKANATTNASRCHACKPEAVRGGVIAVPASRVVAAANDAGNSCTTPMDTTHAHHSPPHPLGHSSSQLLQQSRPMSTLTTYSEAAAPYHHPASGTHRPTKLGSVVTLPSMQAHRESSYAGNQPGVTMAHSPCGHSGHPLQSHSPARHPSMQPPPPPPQHQHQQQQQQPLGMSCAMAARSTSSDATSHPSCYNLATFGYDAKSVDAIFDYERYLALLNGCAEGGESWEHRYLKLQRERDEAIARLMKERYSARQAAHIGRRLSDEELGMLYTSLEREQARLKQFQWFLHVALEEAKMQLSEELQLIRAAHLAFVEEQRQQQSAMQAGLHELQRRANSLIGFFHSFMDHVAHVMRGMTREAGAKSQAELLQRHDAMRAQNGFAEFYHYGQLAEGDNDSSSSSSSLAGNNHKSAAAMAAAAANEAAAFWLHNPVTARAKRLLTSLLQLAGKLRASKAMQLSKELNERVHLMRRRSMLSDFGRRDSAVSLSRSTRQSFSIAESLTRSHGLNEAYLTAPVFGAENMTGRTLLQELVRLRLRRAANCVRRDNCERRLGSLLTNLDLSLATDSGAATSNNSNNNGGGGAREAGAAKKRHGEGEAACAEDQRRCWMLLSQRATTRVEEDTRLINRYMLLLRQHLARYRLRRAQSALLSGSAGAHAELTEEQRRRQELALLQSPYLYDPDVLSSARYLQDHDGNPLTLDTASALLLRGKGHTYGTGSTGGNGGGVMSGVLYVPFGQNSVDADGQPVNYVVFDQERISLYPYRTDEATKDTAAAATQGSRDTQKERAVRTRGEAVTAYGAVIQYCQGVQAGLPVGNSLGPVYLFRDADTDGFYVGDAAGQRLLSSQEETAGAGDKGSGAVRPNAGGGDLYGSSYYYDDSSNSTGRNAMPMTQILIPAPWPPSQPTADTAHATANGEIDAATVHHDEGTNNAVRQDEPYRFHYKDAGQQREARQQTSSAPLAPLYLAPMVVPTDGGALAEGGSEGALYRTRDSALYDTADGPVPLAASPNALLPTAPLPLPQYATLYATTSRSAAPHVQEPPQPQQQPQLSLRPNPYLFAPPRICHPEPESATALRIQGVLPPAPPPPVLQPGMNRLLRTAAVNCSPAVRLPGPDTMSAQDSRLESKDVAGVPAAMEGDYTAHPHETMASCTATGAPSETHATNTVAGKGNDGDAAPPVPCLSSPRQPPHGALPRTRTSTPVNATSVGLPLAVDEVRQRQSARQECAVRQRSRERLARRAEWARCRAMPEPTEKEKYLRLRLPGLPGNRHTTQLLPSPQSTVQLQRKLRPLTLQGVGHTHNTSSHNDINNGVNGAVGESEASSVLQGGEENVTASHSVT